MKRLLTLLIALTLVTSATLTPRPARAAMSISATNGTIGIVLGSILIGSSLFFMRPKFEAPAEIGIVLILGLFLLDGENGAEAAFAPLTIEEANRLSIQESERLAYNGELAELNAIRQTITSEAMSAEQAGRPMSSEQLHARWTEYKAQVSPEAFSTLEKVAAQVLQ